MDSEAGATCGCEPTLVVVEPAPVGWRLCCEGCGEPMMFLSGHDAELQAHALAQSLAAAGQEVRVTIRDRRDVVAGSFAYHAAGA